MKKLTIGNNQGKIDLNINQRKWVIGTNEERKFQIKKLIKLYFSKTESEERKENENEAYLKIDGAPVDTKRTFLYEINESFSINEECKLGAKSLLAKIIECRLGEMDLFDTINTIDILFESLSEEMEDEQFNIKVEFSKMVAKQLIKLMKPYYIDELQKDEFDLSLEELYSFQIQLILELQKYYQYEEYIIIVDKRVISQSLLDKLSQLEDTYCIIFTNHINEDLKIEDIALNEDTLLDLSDNENVYALFGEVNGVRLSYEEVNKMIEIYLKQEYAHIDHCNYNKIMSSLSSNSR